ARPHRNEIKIRRQVRQLLFSEQFLEGNITVRAVAAFPRVWIDQVVFVGVDEVDVENGRRLDREILRQIAGVSLEELGRDDQVLDEELRFSLTKEIETAGAAGADAAGHRRPPRLDQRVAGERQDEELVLIENR